jgi:Lrp/AsnC family leucine-responsive transcriptional regulator
MALDKTDIKISNILQENGRITNAKLAAEIGISPPAMLERVKRLEASGVIKKYLTILDREKTGFGLMAIIIISLSLHQISSLQQVKERLIILEEVLECYQLTGDVDFMLKVAVRDMPSYTAFINDKLSSIPGIQNIRTSFVLDTLKSTTKLLVKAE